MDKKVMPARPFKVRERDRKSLLNSIRHMKIEFFPWRDNEFGDILFNIDDLKSRIATDMIKYTPLQASLNEDFFNHVVKSSSVDVEAARNYEYKDLNLPAISIIWPDGTTTLVDGSHRIVKRYLDELPDFRMYQVPWPQWVGSAYVGRDIPSELRGFFADLPQRGVNVG